jgi:hypothetical protein
MFFANSEDLRSLLEGRSERTSHLGKRRRGSHFGIPADWQERSETKIGWHHLVKRMTHRSLVPPRDIMGTEACRGPRQLLEILLEAIH